MTYPPVRILTKTLCITEVVLWVEAVIRTNVAMVLLSATVPHVSAFQDGIIEDRIGNDLAADQTNSQQVARQAKLFEEKGASTSTR